MNALWSELAGLLSKYLVKGAKPMFIRALKRLAGVIGTFLKRSYRGVFGILLVASLFVSIYWIIQEFGNVPEADMRRTFNLGIGFILIVSKDQVEHIQYELKKIGEESFLIGEVIEKV